MKKLNCIVPLLFLGLSACGGGGAGGGDEPGPGGGPSLPGVLAHSDINMLIIDQGVFDDLPELVQQQKIELKAIIHEENVTLKTNDTVETNGGVLALLASTPNGNENGEICTSRMENVINITGSGEFVVELSGELDGKYTIRECNVEININTSNTEWSAIKSQVFGPQDAATVLLEGIKMSKNISEDTALLYIDDYAENQPHAPWLVLANPDRAIVCLNANVANPGYISYFTPKVSLDSNPPTGYTTDGLEAVDKPVAYLSNCIFNLNLWSGIWNNN